MMNHKMNIMNAIPGNFTMSYGQKLNLCKGYPAGSIGMPLREEIGFSLKLPSEIEHEKVISEMIKTHEFIRMIEHKKVIKKMEDEGFFDKYSFEK